MRALSLRILILAILNAPAASAQDFALDSCHPDPGAPRLDHVVTVVRDLDSAAADYAGLGFRLKPGRLHPDNLLNRHIKFGDGTEIELMTLVGPPGDRMAAEYADLLTAGEGGAYAALMANLDSVAAAAERLALPIQRSSSGTWRFLGFSPKSDAGAVFFGSGWVAPSDPDSIFTHPNGANGLAEAWVEGGDDLRRLLQLLGAQFCSVVSVPDGRLGTRWILGAGSLVLVPRAEPDLRPRVLGVVLAVADAAARHSGSAARQVRGLWLRYR